MISGKKWAKKITKLITHSFPMHPFSIPWKHQKTLRCIGNKWVKGAVMLTEKALIYHRLSVSKVSSKICIPSIYNFAVIYPWNLLFSKKVVYFLTVSLVFPFLFINKTLRLSNLKTGTAINTKLSVFINDHIVVILYNLHDCIFEINETKINSPK